MMRRMVIVAALIGLLLGGSILPGAIPSVQAQETEEGECPFSFVVTFGDSLDDADYTFGPPYVWATGTAGVLAPGDGNPGDGARSTVVSTGGSSNSYVSTTIALPDSLGDITLISYTWDYWEVGAQIENRLYILDDSGSVLESSEDTDPSGIAAWFSGGNNGDSWVLDEAAAYVMLSVGVQGDGSEEARIDNVAISGTYLCEGYIRPLAAEDESPVFGMFNYEAALDIAAVSVAQPYYPLHAGFSPYTVTAVARRPGMPVHAAAAGTVEEVTPLEYSDCGEGVARPDGTWFTNDGLGDCAVSFFQIDEFDSFTSGTVPIQTAYRVTINAGGLYFVYVVANAPDYVSVGDTVSGGCVLGETLGLDESSWDLFVGLNFWIVNLGTTLTISAEDILAGFTVVTAYETELEDPDANLVNELVVYPNNDHPCNQEPETSECMGSNPRFLRGGDGWLVSGSTGANFQIGGGVIINPGAQVYMPMLLDSGTEYDVTVGGIDIFTSLGTALKVRIGTVNQIFPLSPGDPEDGRVVLDDATPAGPIADGVYEVGLQVTGSDPVFVEYACITDATNTPQVPSACYFANHSFDFDSSGWTAGASIQFPGDGTAIMRDDSDGTLAQPFNLEDGDYTLSARVRAYYSTEASIPSLPDGDVDLHYDMGDGETTLGSLVFTVFDPGWIVLTTTFSLVSPDTGTIEFYLDINDGSEELLGLTIDRFCLERDGGYTPPGGGVPPIINPTCEIVANPNDTSIGAWIAWLWAKLDQFFQCDLMLLLDQLYVQVVNGINTMLRFSRYMIIVAQRQASWFSTDAIPWLNGHLNNIAQGRTTTIIQDGGGQCNNLFCLLETLINRVLGPIVDAITQLVDVLLDLFTSVVGLLLDIITGLVALLFALFGSIIGFIIRLFNYLSSLIGGFNNATPLPLPGIPQCQLDPQGNAVCIGLWMMENTIFADEGQLYIPLLIGAFSIFLLFWLVDTFRKEISNLGDKL